MRLLLSHEDIARALMMEICIDTLQEFYRELVQGRGSARLEARQAEADRERGRHPDDVFS
jgi:hypothetical protein